MLKKIVSVFLICLLVFPIYVYFSSEGSEIDSEYIEQAKNYFQKEDGGNKPCKKTDGSKFTIGYLDIDPYPATGEMLYYFVDELRKQGWITHEEEFPFDPTNTDAKEFIKYLSEQDLGEYICFSKDVNYYVSEEYDGVKYIKKELKKHIENKDVDLIFCLGTSPAVLMIKEMGITEVPIMVSGTVDPVGSGIAKTEEYSGQSNVWCHTNTGVYRNQMKYYYDACAFKKIGMVYYDETIGSVEPYSQAAEELGFEIIGRKIDAVVTSDYYQKLEKLYRELVAQGIDAFLLNSDIIKDEKKINELLNIFYEKNIPVFVQNSEYYVEDGATMVVTASDEKTQAPFLVDAFGAILNGQEPGSLNQKFVTPPYLSINLEIADRIGFDINEKMILSAEHLYTNVKEVE